MEIAFSFILIVYLTLLVYVWNTWRKIPLVTDQGSAANPPGVTIVIAVRNEQVHIEQLVESLKQLDYPSALLEVIIVNDHSDDNTKQLLELYTAKNPSFKLIDLDDSPGFNGSYKKRALTKGIDQASHEIIITTDGDCLFEPAWVSKLVESLHFQQWEMATGPVIYQSGNWTSHLLNIELASLVAVGAVSLTKGHPNMCNGANLAFTKKAFQAVDGYKGFEQVISGDDEFLLYKIFNRYPHRVGFVKHRSAVVTTAPPKSLSQFLNQRKRWSGKWKRHKSMSTRLLAIFVFFFHLSFTLVLLLSLSGYYSWGALLVQCTCKLIAEFLLVNSVLRFMDKRVSIKWYLVMQILYSIYVVLVVLIVQFTGFTWKNRSYK